ncbi:hypothetical protein ONZ43_g5971 [Nemania bipapillata]|uniref:Uncharacterized protein n=1 Tax=Nemania bipapillata TaxID=110536 RepID=A0ACC2I420_9PEZI|nr:hypothetical protein ONZ43_g5971 [Nemania bipapillata]
MMTMPAPRTLLRTLVVYASFTVAFTNAAYFGAKPEQGDSLGVEDQNQDGTVFSRMLSAVSPRHLSQLLHEYVPVASSEDDGSSKWDRRAMDAVHIVHLAIRQSSSVNDTTTSDTPTTTTSSTPVSTTTTSDIPSTTTSNESTTSTEEASTETTTTAEDTPHVVVIAIPAVNYINYINFHCYPQHRDD